MYAYRLKLGPRSFTTDEVIYYGIQFKDGLSTKPVSQQEHEMFMAVGFDVELVPVTSPEYDDLRKEIEEVKANAAAYEAKLAAGFQKQIEVLEAAVQQTVNERDEARKQLSLNLELMELRNLHFNGKVVENVKDASGSRGGSVPRKG